MIKRKITSFILCLAMLVSVIAVLPIASAAADTALGVTLTDGVLLNFYIEADDTLGVTNAELKDGYYVLTEELAAKEMGDEVTVQLKSGDTAVGKAYTSSVKEYAAGILAGSYGEETKTLVQAMLNYGAAAQKYFDYKTNALVGTPVTDSSALLQASVENAEIVDKENIYAGATLVLEGTMKLRFYFAGNDLAITVDGESSAVVNKGDGCYVDIKVTPDSFDKVYEVAVGKTVVKYSVLNYLKNNANNEDLSEMVASIYAYGVAAKEYVRIVCCEHESTEYEIIQPATLFNKGVKVGECGVCGEIITKNIDTTEPDVSKFNSPNSKTASYTDRLNLVKDVLGSGRHFYPHEENGNQGRDLFVEFSFLYNETLANNSKGYIDIFRIESDDESQGHSFYFLNLRDNVSGQWCPYEGRFETGDIDYATEGVYDGPKMPNHEDVTNETEEDYVSIGGYGWHRMGIQVHQEAKIVNGEVVYTVSTTFYIDGDVVSRYYIDLISEKNNYNDLLYTATIGQNGQLVYKDIDDNKNILFYKLREIKSSSTYYVVTADKYATADGGFVIDVESVKNPESNTFTAEGGINLDGKVYFKTQAAPEFTEEETDKADDKKVLLVSIDGLRPDALFNSQYFPALRDMGSYSMSAQTIYPSKTLPAHMSMFHSVTPDTHGILVNEYKPSSNLANGITETLSAAGKTSAMFIDWEDLHPLTTLRNEVQRHYIQWYSAIGEDHHERSTIELCDAVYDHVNNSPTDFTFLYFGMTDQMGHDHNWLSEKYYYAIDHILENLLSLIDKLPENYTVIITADHGGGGDLGANQHGSSATVDMTTPFFVIGDGFEEGKAFGSSVSILDVAPTVADVLDVDAEEYWEGKSLCSADESHINEFKYTTSSSGAVYSNKLNIVNDVLDGKHFYPTEENPDGLDLFVEFSFLYNRTLTNNTNAYIDIFRIESYDNVFGHSFYFLNLKNNVTGQWCPYKGGFETGNIDKDAGGVYYGPSMPNHAEVDNETEEDYVSIGEYGWHRMGIRVHQEAKIVNNKVVYTVDVTFYIDGVIVSRYYVDLIDSSYNDLLYTATIGSDGKLVYQDIADDRNIIFYKLRDTKGRGNYYIVTTDAYATAGNDFVLKVEPESNPESAIYRTEQGTKLDGTTYFKYAD